MKKLFIAWLICLMCLSLTTPVKAATIKISATSANIKAGKTKTLSIKNTSRKVTWSSTNRAIAKVSAKGKVTALKTGSCTIKAKVKGKNKVYTCKVKVTAWLSASSVSMTSGFVQTLTLKGTTIKSCSSTDKAIVKVAKSSASKVKLTAVKKGSATVKVKAHNGVTYKCKVKVIASALAVSPASATKSKEFIEAIAPLVQKHAKAYGYGVPSAIIAQACLESAYGTSNKAHYHNYFGLKYRVNRLTCHSGSFTDTSKEQNADGSYTSIKTKWFKFDSMDSGVEGYFQFISISNYSAARKTTTPEAYLTALKSGGYATSLNYVKNVMAVITKWNLTKYDS